MSPKQGHLILMRHGQSMWNVRPGHPSPTWRYAGAVDVPLSEEGIHEALAAGRALRSLSIDVVYCSMLIRAQTTTLIALASHEDGKAPLLVRDTEQGLPRGIRVHTGQMSESSRQTVLPVYCATQLNERSFGDLQGVYDHEQKKVYTKSDLDAFRRDWYVPFPGGESQAECYDRSAQFFERHIRAQLAAGRSVLVVAHGFVVRAILAHILELSPRQYCIEMVLDLKHDPKSQLASKNAIPRIFQYTPKEEEGSKRSAGTFTDVTHQYPLLPDEPGSSKL
jgi:2,3-bisphosphoglycerate-dependent phosphoglycerate mutase